MTEKSIDLSAIYKDYFQVPLAMAEFSVSAEKRGRVNRLVWLKQLKRSFINGGYLFILFLLCQLNFFLFFFIYYGFSGKYQTTYDLLGISFPIAKGAGGALNFNFGIILFGSSLKLLTFLSRFSWLRNFMLLNYHKQGHRIIGIFIFVFTIIHVLAHVVNFSTLSKAFHVPFAKLWFLEGVNTTGNMALLLLCLMVFFSIPFFRRRFYEVFIGFHQLYILLYVVLIVHGSYCFIKADTEPKCSDGGIFWKICILPLIIHLVDRLLRVVQYWKPVDIVSVLEKSQNIFEIKFRKESWYNYGINNFIPGQYLQLRCPDISLFQTHPFSITSNPEDPYMSINIFAKGNFTRSLKEMFYNASTAGKAVANFDVSLTQESFLPSLHISGPYFAPADEAIKFDISVLIGCGIGVTPFISVLNSFCYHYKNCHETCGKKIYFIWLCRTAEEFHNFSDVLKLIQDSQLDGIIHVSLYWTLKECNPSLCHKIAMSDAGNDVVTSLHNVKSYFGRPMWNTIFDKVETNHCGKTVGVFVCGPKSISKNLQNILNERQDIVKYKFHSENF